jgi:hypothetical protein
MNASAIDFKIRSSKAPSAQVDIRAPHTQDLIETIVTRNRRGVRQLAYRLGYVVTNKTDLFRLVERMLKAHGANGFDALVKLHPDRELILQVCGPAASAGPAPATAPGGHLAADVLAEAPFTGAAPVASLASLAAGVILHHRPQLVALLGEYGSPLPADATDTELVDGLVYYLHNPRQRGRDFRTDFAALATSPYASFAGIGEAIGGVGNLLGGVTGVIAAGTNRKAAQDQQRTDIMLSLLNQRTATQQAQSTLSQSAIAEAAATKRRLYSMLALAGVAVVIALVALVVLTNRKAA